MFCKGGLFAASRYGNRAVDGKAQAPQGLANAVAPLLQAITEILGRKAGRQLITACDLLSSLSTFSAFICCSDSRLMQPFSSSTGKNDQSPGVALSLTSNSAG